MQFFSLLSYCVYRGFSIKTAQTHIKMKGISTYDYILAMRERDQLNGAGERLHSPYASPASSVATAMSGASSMGTLHPAPWCTPPRLFVDHEVKIHT